jgi:hypothetical protein
MSLTDFFDQHFGVAILRGSPLIFVAELPHPIDRSVRRVPMAKLTRSNSKTALAEGKLTFSTGIDRISIGLTSHENGLTYHLHMSEAEAHRFAVFLAERNKVRV